MLQGVHLHCRQSDWLSTIESKANCVTWLSLISSWYSWGGGKSAFSQCCTSPLWYKTLGLTYILWNRAVCTPANQREDLVSFPLPVMHDCTQQAGRAVLAEIPPDLASATWCLAAHVDVIYSRPETDALHIICQHSRALLINEFFMLY